MVVTVEAEEWRLRLEPFEQVLFLLCWRNSMRMVEFFIWTWFVRSGQPAFCLNGSITLGCELILTYLGGAWNGYDN